jgi:hypothetical protein
LACARRRCLGLFDGHGTLRLDKGQCQLEYIEAAWLERPALQSRRQGNR